MTFKVEFIRAYNSVNLLHFWTYKRKLIFSQPLVFNVLLFFDPVKGQKFSRFYAINNITFSTCFQTPNLLFNFVVFCQVVMACTVHFFGFCGCEGISKLRHCFQYQPIFLGALSILFLCYSFESQEVYSFHSKAGVFRRVIGLSGSIFASMENHCSSWKLGQVPLRMFSFVACCL